jgi:uncharacterized repeat protein (TIGR01451 family)
MSHARLLLNRGLACGLTCMLLYGAAAPASAQRPVHHLYRSDLPPGTVGTTRARQPGGGRTGYVQPIQIIVPAGAVVSPANDGEFAVASTDLRIGLMFGQPYRLRITDIPRHEGQELYPSIEVIDRLHPPPGQKNRFPITIEITQDDLELALNGGMVVRVIYLENPNEAFPKRDEGEQRSVDVLPSEDPLHVADDYGRPMAIVRLGSRVPIDNALDASFLFGSPPVEWITADDQRLGLPSGAASAVDNASPLVDAAGTTFPDDSSWLEQAIDPNCPCLRMNDPADCQCGLDEDPNDRPEGIVGPWPPDEYICDGGDRETRVVVNAELEVSGLDLEDTILHYDTLGGNTLVAASNSVCIYAPRFAAVRKIVQASEDDRLLTMHELEQPLPAIVDLDQQRPVLVNQPLPTLRDVGLKAPLALRYRTRGVDLLNVLPVRELVNDFEAYEDLQIIRLGVHRRSERPLLLESTRAAEVWTAYLAPEVILDEEIAQVDVRVEKAEALYRVDQGPPRLRVIKVASCGSVRPGDEITFTLRFDNIGEQTIGNVTLLDNLTTRLEYIPDTAQCSLHADFFTDQNEGESLTLRWEIRDPVKPGDGGILRFRCLVR